MMFCMFVRMRNSFCLLDVRRSSLIFRIYFRPPSNPSCLMMLIIELPSISKTKQSLINSNFYIIRRKINSNFIHFPHQQYNTMNVTMDIGTDLIRCPNSITNNTALFTISKNFFKTY